MIFKPASARHESARKKDSSVAAYCCSCRRPRCLPLLLLQKLDHREFIVIFACQKQRKFS
jgi:hypothetical protein